jgi:hypothetical protein
MTLIRMVVTLAGALALMLAIVIFRSETTRLHSEVERLDRKADGLVQQIRQEELELARLRNPAVIRARVAEMRLAGQPPPAERGAARKKSH